MSLSRDQRTAMVSVEALVEESGLQGKQDGAVSEIVSKRIQLPYRLLKHIDSGPLSCRIDQLVPVQVCHAIGVSGVVPVMIAALSARLIGLQTAASSGVILVEVGKKEVLPRRSGTRLWYIV